jgi:hypothetical protein
MRDSELAPESGFAGSGFPHDDCRQSGTRVHSKLVVDMRKVVPDRPLA